MAEVERATRLQRLDDSTSSLLEAYARLIKSAQVHGATEQQASSFQSSVLVAGLVSTANLGQPCARATICPPCVPTVCSSVRSCTPPITCWPLVGSSSAPSCSTTTAGW